MEGAGKGVVVEHADQQDVPASLAGWSSYSCRDENDKHRYVAELLRFPFFFGRENERTGGNPGVFS